jgi:hypothetical protein
MALVRRIPALGADPILTQNSSKSRFYLRGNGRSPSQTRKIPGTNLDY